MFFSRFFLTLSMTVSVAHGLFGARKLAHSEVVESPFLQKIADHEHVDLNDAKHVEKEVDDGEWTVPEWLEGGNRKLLQSCQDVTDDTGFSCFLALFDNDDDTGIYGSCGGLSDRKDSNWCSDPDLGDICCGSSDDCCEPNVGAIVGISIALFAVIVLSIVACCFCCPCCCMHKSKRGGGEATASAVAEPVGESK